MPPRRILNPPPEKVGASTRKFKAHVIMISGATPTEEAALAGFVSDRFTRKKIPHMWVQSKHLDCLYAQKPRKYTNDYDAWIRNLQFIWSASKDRTNIILLNGKRILELAAIIEDHLETADFAHNPDYTNYGDSAHEDFSILGFSLKREVGAIRGADRSASPSKRMRATPSTEVETDEESTYGTWDDYYETSDDEWSEEESESADDYWTFDGGLSGYKSPGVFPRWTHFEQVSLAGKDKKVVARDICDVIIRKCRPSHPRLFRKSSLSKAAAMQEQRDAQGS